MEQKQISTKLRLFAILAVFVVGAVFTSYTRASAAYDPAAVQGLVEKARATLNDFTNDQKITGFREDIDHARGVLIFPEMAKGGLILGGSGGTGVFLVKDEKTGEWSEPAFYTAGSITLGLQFGGETAEVIVAAMTQNAIDSLMSSSFKFGGGEASVAFGPSRAGGRTGKTSDFVVFARSRGIYAGLNLDGVIVTVRDNLNRAYYGKDVTPADILVKRDVSNKMSASLRETLKKAG